jgi:hypothetical protein
MGSVVVLRDAVLDTGDPYAGGEFTVELHGRGLDVVRTVFVYSWHGLDKFFDQLVERWRGWEGSETWESPEGDLTVDAHADHTGHVMLRFRVQDGPMPSWQASIEVMVDGGEDMASLARDVHDLLASPAQ